MPSANSSHSNTASRKSRRFWYWILGAVIIVVLDQITKSLISTNLSYGARLHVLPFFDLTLLYNPGAAFSLLADGHGWERWLFTVIALGAAGLIINLLWRYPSQRVFCTSLMAILGGAVGNLTDRMQHGHVIDFLLFYWNGWYFPAFNVADIAITCGAVLLFLDEILRMRRERRKASKSI
ncbi:MAG: signal peptidase II [Burkholderiaceae bacterium]|nr:MAG: signal peptidase II [Burkholderiaceae bacterium]TAM02839.1 MAG: signal peptidase II [Pusillimonas sp.]